MPAPGAVAPLDPFDLPEWLGTAEVTWSSPDAVRAGHLVTGELSAADDRIGCDLLAVDEAYPAPVLAEQWRTSCHRAWVHGQLLVLEVDDRVTLAVPGTELSADLAVEVISRLAKAVGAPRHRFVVAWRC